MQTNLIDAAASVNEVMLYCDQYIAIPVSLLNEQSKQPTLLILTP
ncbi:hypothetical protein [Massilia sp.]